MKITFRLRFHTEVGQSLFLTGEPDWMGAGQTGQAIPLQYLNPEFWQVSIDLDENYVLRKSFSYSYLLKNSDGSTVQDWGNGRSVYLSFTTAKEIVVVDSWIDMGNPANVFFTEPFKKVLLNTPRADIGRIDDAKATHTFKIRAPLLAAHETICLLGDGPEFGNWNTHFPRFLHKRNGEDFFDVCLKLASSSVPKNYKYAIWNTVERKFVRYEHGANRILIHEAVDGQQTIVDDGFIWLPVDEWKGAGVAIPVFSLRSDEGFGVGEFADLKRLVDWGKKVGLKLIQILPINDTNATNTWRDSYPYAAISAFALHPLYLNLETLVAGKKPLPAALLAERKRLNTLDAVDYEAVMAAKMKFIKEVFAMDKKTVFERADFKDYFAQNKHWLVPYSAFCALRDKNKTPDFNRWPWNRTYQAAEITALSKKDLALAEAMDFNYFVQFQLHLQLKNAAEYAHANGIIIKGDIAIGVHKHGADVWQQPELFFTDKQAGAPPDPFDAKGQNWGFPTYNWPRMMQDRLLWWQQRFEQMSLYFDAFRIDHILGFFRIWSNPADTIEGILGVFVPTIPVKLAEFAERGIPFDCERFLKPFIDDTTMQTLFGNATARVKKDFLTAAQGNMWNLTTEFATQQKVEEHFSQPKLSAADKKVRQGLFDLITNVILLPSANPDEFHFRFGMMDTLSFKALDPDAQAKLKELYVDYFFRRQEGLWKEQAMQKLPALKRATNMLICGEDLGMVPDCVPVVMKQLGLLSLEIQRMPKTLNTDFSRLTNAPYLSVVTPSTHDMSTIRGWWAEDRRLTQKFFNEELHQLGNAPEDCTAEINRAVVEQHLSSPAIWSIFQLQDLLGMDASIRRKAIDEERINVPANTKNYWRYRMHLTLEQLQKSDTFNDVLQNLIAQYRR